MIGVPRRWVVDVLSGFAGAEEAPGVLAPRPGEVDYMEAFMGMLRDGSFLAGIGMRLALTFCALSPLWLAGRLRRFNSLGGAERAALLDRLLHHRIWMIAELTLLLKLCACMALFRSTTLRERSQYDSHEKGGGLPVAHEDSDELSAEVLESGERLRRSLPVVDDAREEEVA